ncbi:transposase [Pleurocapsa sp. PCC 7319]|uniref:transposase n=1 Tax=Pleurocapsa sp. PCC 7319 TaxID=118161 RepID=UPI0003487480|nr:transposase [Pleurocapsa sp. PCC 7319]
MKYDSTRHHRRSIRLKGYDYSQAGFYFVTICCYQRQCLFGDIVNGLMQLNQYGEIVAETYQSLSFRYSYINLDEWIIMPNHFHGIIVLTDKPCRGVSRNAPTPPINSKPKRKPLGRLIGAFKTVSTKKINLIRNAPGSSVWQRNYYEHIIRNQKSLNNIRQYIINNPISWNVDQLHPNNPSKW